MQMMIDDARASHPYPKLCHSLVLGYVLLKPCFLAGARVSFLPYVPFALCCHQVAGGEQFCFVLVMHTGSLVVNEFDEKGQDDHYGAAGQPDTQCTHRRTDSSGQPRGSVHMDESAIDHA